MKLTSLLHRLNPTKTALVILTPLLLSQAASGAITVHFVEEGPDVRVSFSGTIDLTGAPGTASTREPDSDRDFIDVDAIIIHGRGYADQIGIASPQPFAFVSIPGSDTVPGFFGYSPTALAWDTQHVSSGVAGGTVTALTADPAVDTFVLPGQSLASLNAEASDIAEGATLWTSNGTAGDTFVFSRLAPVPEPSTALLGGISLLVLLRRRR